jgi:hypothetical protein
MNAAVEVKSVETERFEFRQAQAVAHGESASSWDKLFVFDNEAELDFAERIIEARMAEQEAAHAENAEWPLLEEVAIRYEVLGQLYNDVTDKVRFSAHDTFRFYSSASDDTTKALDGLLVAHNAMAAVRINGEFASALIGTLSMYVSAGAAEMKMAHLTEVYKFHDKKDAVKRAVTIDEIAQHVAYEKAYASTKNKTRRYAFKAQALIRSYAIANDVERELVEREVGAYIVNCGLSFIKNRQVWVYKTESREVAKSAN